MAAALLAASEGDLSSIKPALKSGASVCVVIAAKGYPESPVTGGRIEGLEIVADPSTAIAFHAGTRREGREYYVSGGRVLGISAIGEDVGNARNSVYDTVSIVKFDGMQFRKDIGTTGVEQASSASNSTRS